MTDNWYRQSYRNCPVGHYAEDTSLSRLNKKCAKKVCPVCKAEKEDRKERLAFLNGGKK